MEDPKKNNLRRSNSLFMCTQRAIRVRFFRNGDRYFTGFTYPISFNRYKDFEILLKDLSNSVFCDKSVMPCGVRSIFDLSGSKIRSVHQMEESTCYVASGTHSFIPLNYMKETTDPKWKTTKGFVNEVVPLVPLQNRPSRLFNAKSSSQFNRNRPITPIAHRTSSVPFKLGAKIINIIRNSTGRPRQIFQWLLNTKTAPTFGKVLDDFSSLVKLDSGFVKHIFFLNGREVTSLRDFFGDEMSFIAIGTDAIDRNSLIITPHEYALLEKVKKPNAACLNAPSSNNSPLVHPDQNGLQKLTDKYLIGNEIGVGNFAVVKECRDKKKKQILAVKVIDKKKCDKHLNKIYQEMEILKKLRHTNVIELINSFETSDFVYLIMDLSQDGNMLDFILRTQSYSEQDLSGMIHNISAGLFYLHSIHIIHRDVKFENILIDKDASGLMRLKICDFGLATEVAEGETAMTVCGTPHYMAPELFTQEGYTSKVDVWALGVLFHVLLSGVPPYVSDTGDFNEVFDKILQTEVDYDAINQWKHVSDDAKILLNQMLARDVTERIVSVDVLSSPWVAEDNIAANANLWPVVATKITEFLKANEDLEKTYPLDFLAKTSLDKDSNFFESEE